MIPGGDRRDLAFWIVRGTARRMGIELLAPPPGRRFAPAALSDLIARCAACPETEVCLHNLGRADWSGPPSPCPVRETLAPAAPAQRPTPHR